MPQLTECQELVEQRDLDNNVNKPTPVATYPSPRRLHHMESLSQRLLSHHWKGKAEAWTKFLEEAQGKEIWQVLRYTRPRRDAPTPLLTTGNITATSFENKCNVFRMTMFPPPPNRLPLPQPLSDNILE